MSHRTPHHARCWASRYALWRNPENLTTRQQAKLAWIARTDPTPHRACLLKEGLRPVFQLDYLGNYPRALTHAALVQAALALRAAEVGQFVAPPPHVARRADGAA